MMAKRNVLALPPASRPIVHLVLCDYPASQGFALGVGLVGNIHSPHTFFGRGQGREGAVLP